MSPIPAPSKSTTATSSRIPRGGWSSWDATSRFVSSTTRVARKRGIRVPYGARLLFDDGAPVEKGDKLLEWDPYTIPIITEREGIVTFRDLVEGVSMREYVDEATGIANKVVIDWRQQPKGAELRPRITLRDKKGEVVTLANDMEARYFPFGGRYPVGRGFGRGTRRRCLGPHPP